MVTYRSVCRYVHIHCFYTCLSKYTSCFFQLTGHRSKGIPVAVKIPNAQLLVSNINFQERESELLGKILDSRPREIYEIHLMDLVVAESTKNK